MPYLSQFIGIRKDTTELQQKSLNLVRSILKQKPLFDGLSRTYRPKADEGDELPSENKKVQRTVASLLQDLSSTFNQYVDVVATIEWGNCTAKADVIVDGKVFLPQVPVTFLLHMEKQLQELITVLQEVPTLDIAETWNFDTSINLNKSEPVETTRTQKVMTPILLHPPTQYHPAQVDKQQSDVVAGYWRTQKLSGALSEKEHAAMLARVRKLAEAFTFAREEANRTNVTYQHIGEALTAYLFKG